MVLLSLWFRRPWALGSADGRTTRERPLPELSSRAAPLALADSLFLTAEPSEKVGLIITKSV